MWTIECISPDAVEHGGRSPGDTGRSRDRTIRAPAAAVSLALALVLVVGAAVAAEPAVHLGVASCASTTCHGSAKPAAQGNVQGNEYVTWARFDAHAGSWQTLAGERSIAIARRLGLGPAQEARICLDCHAENLAPTRRGHRFQADDGIGCEACHGGAEHWLASHDDFPAVDHAANLAAGMTDLARPASRAAVCTGCHVGDGGGDTDRFASHRLMAAGHPRLSFELDTYTELWRTSGGREHYVRDADYAERKAVPRPGAVWAEGLVASARANLQMIAQRYPAAGALPDFALFNCYSCHRAMRLQDWRDKGHDADTEPGSLRFDDSLLRTLQSALVSRPQLRRELGAGIAALQAAAGTDRDTVRGRAAALDALLGTIGAEFAARPLSAAEESRALADLAGGAQRGAYPDYVGAEHAAMGLSVLAFATGERERHRATLDALFAALESDERYDARRFAELLRAMPRR
jgi:hypothetical protein